MILPETTGWMSTFSGNETASFFGVLGDAAVIVFSCMGAVYEMAKSNARVASKGVMQFHWTSAGTTTRIMGDAEVGLKLSDPGCSGAGSFCGNLPQALSIHCHELAINDINDGGESAELLTMTNLQDTEPLPTYRGRR